MEKKSKKTQTKVVEKKPELAKKESTFKKKKKVKRNITSGIAYVYSTFNNTIVSIADESGNVVSWSSAGAKGFKGSRKSTPYAAQVAADDAGGKAYEQGLILVSAGSNCLRLAPALNISNSEIEKGVEILKQVLLGE